MIRNEVRPESGFPWALGSSRPGRRSGSGHMEAQEASWWREHEVTTMLQEDWEGTATVDTVQGVQLPRETSKGSGLIGSTSADTGCWGTVRLCEWSRMCSVVLALMEPESPSLPTQSSPISLDIKASDVQ